MKSQRKATIDAMQAVGPPLPVERKAHDTSLMKTISGSDRDKRR
jgi:hypothetical protein